MYKNVKSLGFSLLGSTNLTRVELASTRPLFPQERKGVSFEKDISLHGSVRKHIVKFERGYKIFETVLGLFPGTGQHLI